MSKVWVVLQNVYEGDVAGVFDNEEDAVEACRVFPGTCEADSYELNALPKHPLGTQRFRVALDKNGEVLTSWRTDPMWPEPSKLAVVRRVAPGQGVRYAQAISVYLWAKDKKEAEEQAKAAADKFLAGEQAAHIVNSWPDWKKNIGHALQPPTPD